VGSRGCLFPTCFPSLQTGNFPSAGYAVTLISQADFEARQKQVESSAPNKPGMVITAESISIDKGTGVVDASDGRPVGLELGAVR